MKKILSLILASLLAVVLVSCGSSGSNGSASNAKTVEEVQSAWEALGYEVTTLAETDLAFDTATAQKGVQVLDYENKLIAMAYFEFASASEVEGVVKSFQDLNGQDGTVIEQVNDNFIKIKDESGTVGSYLLYNDKYLSLGLPLGEESIVALDEAYEAIGFTVK